MRLATLTLLAIALASPSFGQAQCGPRADVLAMLATRYDESRRAYGLAGESGVMELFTSTAGSWTITLTTPDGRTCIVGGGSGFEAVNEAPGVEG